MSETTTDEMGELGSPIPLPQNSAPTNPAIRLNEVPPGLLGQGSAPTTQDFTAAFGPPVEHIAKDGTVLVFPLITMDDWAATAKGLQLRRREATLVKLRKNPFMSPQDIELILGRLDGDLITLMDAFGYRTKTAEGIQNGLIRQLMKGNKVDAATATRYVKALSPFYQQALMKDIADPPDPLPPAKPGQPSPNVVKPTSNEIGSSMPASFEESSDLTPGI